MDTEREDHYNKNLIEYGVLEPLHFGAKLTLNSGRFLGCLVLKCWGELQNFRSASYLPCIIGTFENPKAP